MGSNVIPIIALLFNILYILLFIRCIVSWLPIFPGDPSYNLAEGVRQITDPLLLPFQKIIPPIGGIDLSLLFAIIALQMFEQMIYQSLRVV